MNTKDISPREKAAILESAGLKPWEGRLVDLPDGNIAAERIDTEDRGAFETFVRGTLREIPQAVATAVGSALGGAAGGAVGTALAPATGPLAPIAPLAGRFTGGVVGGFGANMAYNAMPIAKTIDRVLSGSEHAEQQDLRDMSAHPYAYHGGRFLGMLTGFGPAKLKPLAAGLGSLGWRAATRSAALNPEVRQAVTDAVVNPVVSGGFEAARQIAEPGSDPIDWSAVGREALMGLALGNRFGPRAEKLVAGFTKRPRVGPAPVEPNAPYVPTDSSALVPMRAEARPPELPDVTSRLETADALQRANQQLAEVQGEPPGLAEARRLSVRTPVAPGTWEQAPAQSLAGAIADARAKRGTEIPPVATMLPAGETVATITERVRDQLRPMAPMPQAPQIRIPATSTGEPAPLPVLAPMAPERLDLGPAPARPTLLQEAIAVNAITRPELRPVETLQPKRPTPELTEAERIQQELETRGRAARYQPSGESPSMTPELQAQGRAQLERRGLTPVEQAAPIQTGPLSEPFQGPQQQAGGSYDPATGEVRIAPQHAQGDVYAHEGIHAEIDDMMRSDNPRVRALAEQIRKTADEETLAMLGGQIATKREGSLLRLIQDNWDYLRFRFGSQTPERAAAILASRFATEAPSPRNGGTGSPQYQPAVFRSVAESEAENARPFGLTPDKGKRYQPIAQKPEYTPGSVVASAAKVSPEAARATQATLAERDQIIGRIFNPVIAGLQKMDKAVVNSALWKRLHAQRVGATPQYTPEEQAADALYSRGMIDSEQFATRNGMPIQRVNFYVPEILSMRVARMIEKGAQTVIDKYQPAWDAINRQVQGAAFDPVDSKEALVAYVSGVQKAPGSQGSDFGALTKSRRQYHLPDEMIEPDQVQALKQYAERYATHAARQIRAESDPVAARMLGFEVPADRADHLDPALQKARRAVDNTLFNVGRGSAGVDQDVKDLAFATQRLTYSMGMQTGTAAFNTLSKFPQHLAAVSTPEEHGVQARAAVRGLTDFQGQYEKALRANVIRPHQDPRVVTEEMGLTNKTAQSMDAVANFLRRATLAESLETMNRVQDYTIGEDLAAHHLDAPNTEAAKQFFNRFGADVDTNMPREEQLARMARNYAKSIQGFYNAEGLPAGLLSSSIPAHLLRLQRFGWENMNRIGAQVIKPIWHGDYKPLLTYLFGAALIAPVRQKLGEWLSGRPSGLPTQEEVVAGKHNAIVETTLNLMSLAQLTGSFGTAGQVAGALAQGARGNPQAAALDPAVSYTASVVYALADAKDAIASGEPVVPTLLEAGKRAVIDNMQLLRGLGVDRDEAVDRRNKKVFEQQNDRRQQSTGDIVHGLLVGSNRRPQIQPRAEAARKGDIQAFRELDKNDRARVFNYPGGYQDPKIEAQYRQWLLRTQGPEALRAYVQRRTAYMTPKFGQ